MPTNMEKKTMSHQLEMLNVHFQVVPSPKDICLASTRGARTFLALAPACWERTPNRDQGPVVLISIPRGLQNEVVSTGLLLRWQMSVSYQDFPALTHLVVPSMWCVLFKSSLPFQPAGVHIHPQEQLWVIVCWGCFSKLYCFNSCYSPWTCFRGKAGYKPQNKIKSIFRLSFSL